jgi:N-acyl-D-amino-acid deacylase
LMEGVEDIPGAVMAKGVPFNWESFPDYLDALDQRHSDIDFAAQLPHSPLRVYVMGDRGASLEPPTDADLKEMRRLTAQAVEAGALGVSTSRNIAHRFRDGRLAPSISTEESELMALAAGLRDAGKGVFQIVPNTSKPADDEFAVIRRIAEACGRPVSFSMITGDHAAGSTGWRNYLVGLEKAEHDKVPIRGQFYPRPIGILFGLELSFHPFSLNPTYRTIEHLPLADKVAAMRNPEMRARLLAEEPEDANPQVLWTVKRSRSDLLFALGEPPNYTPSMDESITARAKLLGISTRELVYDELLRQGGKAVLYCPQGNMEGGRLDAAAELFGKPGLILGLGDGGAHYGMICDAAYPTFMLSEYVHASQAKNGIGIELAVSMLARETAEAVGLYDRGVLKLGYKADINVIDLTRLRLYAPHISYDLPAGGRRLTQQADGYEATIVSGQVTYRNGRATDALPGRLVRGARRATNKANLGGC